MPLRQGTQKHLSKHVLQQELSRHQGYSNKQNSKRSLISWNLHSSRRKDRKLANKYLKYGVFDDMCDGENKEKESGRVLRGWYLQYQNGSRRAQQQKTLSRLKAT